MNYPTAHIYGSLIRSNCASSLFSRFVDLLRRTLNYLIGQWRLAYEIGRRNPDVVLLDSYVEYLAPLWVWPHILLAKSFRVIYIANLHDPVRDFVVGPKWWHELSVRLAYIPIKICTVHHQLTDTGIVPPHVNVVQVPHGVYDLSDSARSKYSILCEWGIPESSVVFLSFGFVRDNKNLDLLIKALPSVPIAVVVVLGSEQSTRNRPLSFYKDLAKRLGVAERVIFKESFVPDDLIYAYFRAADVIAITYDSSFVSQSGVLNAAVRCRRRILASSGDGPLKASVLKFNLGEFVQPNSLDAVIEGMQKLVNQISLNQHCPQPDWEGYESYASWHSNVQLIIDAASPLLSHSRQKECASMLLSSRKTSKKASK